MSPRSVAERRDRFRELHASGLFLMPNAWDIGSARILASMGFEALATTSLGHAAALGKLDLTVTREEMLDHVEALSSAIDLPLNVDSQRCFADDPAGVARTVAEIAARGAAGCSIEDYDPDRDAIDPIDVAVQRVSAAAEAAHRHGMVLTARAENHVYGRGDLADTVRRLVAYREAGADVVYAPRLSAADDIRRVVEATDAPANVLAVRDAPPVAELARIGVRRVSTGGALARAAYGALVAAANELRTAGTSTYIDAAMTGPDLDRALALRSDG